MQWQYFLLKFVHYPEIGTDKVELKAYIYT